MLEVKIMHDSLIVFVAVVYNNYDDTRDFCVSLANQSDFNISKLACYIVDNSDVETDLVNVKELENEFHFVRVLRSGRNLGYFGAFNYFFGLNLVSSHQFVVICNNDLEFSPNFCKTLFQADFSNDIHAVCPDVITKDGIHQNPHVLKPWGRLARLKLDLYFTHYYVACVLKIAKRIIQPVLARRKVSNSNESCYLHMGIGACYVLTPLFFQHFSSLEFPHFLYGEEAYLTRQIHSAKGKLFYESKLKVAHKESATLSKLPSKITYEFGREGYWHYRGFY